MFGISRHKSQDNNKMCLTETLVKMRLNLILVHFKTQLYTPNDSQSGGQSSAEDVQGRGRASRLIISSRNCEKSLQHLVTIAGFGTDI